MVNTFYWTLYTIPSFITNENIILNLMISEWVFRNKGIRCKTLKVMKSKFSRAIFSTYYRKNKFSIRGRFPFIHENLRFSEFSYNRFYLIQMSKNCLNEYPKKKGAWNMTRCHFNKNQMNVGKKTFFPIFKSKSGERLISFSTGFKFSHIDREKKSKVSFLNLEKKIFLRN